MACFPKWWHRFSALPTPRVGGWGQETGEPGSLLVGEGHAEKLPRHLSVWLPVSPSRGLISSRFTLNLTFVTSGVTLGCWNGHRWESRCSLRALSPDAPVEPRGREGRETALKREAGFQ